MTCLEIRGPRACGLADLAASRYRQLRAGRPATECERGRDLSALAGTPNKLPTLSVRDLRKQPLAAAQIIQIGGGRRAGQPAEV